MKTLWVGALCMGLMGGIAFADESKEEAQDQAPNAATGAKKVEPKGMQGVQFKAMKIQGANAARAGAAGQKGEPANACEGCEEAKAKAAENAGSEKNEAVQCGTCQKYHICDESGNCYANACKDCLMKKFNGEKGPCAACQQKKGAAAAGLRGVRAGQMRGAAAPAAAPGPAQRAPAPVNEMPVDE